jgi:hypothetical protein
MTSFYIIVLTYSTRRTWYVRPVEKNVTELSGTKLASTTKILRTETKSAALLVVSTSVQPISSAPEPGVDIDQRSSPRPPYAAVLAAAEYTGRAGQPAIQ